MKLLEIGLGCNMKYGPGISAHLWTTLLGKHGDVWFGETDAECVTKLKQQRLEYNVVVGNQGDAATCRRWVEETGGNFDVVIDDGSHRNMDIKTSLEILFPTLKSGGLYFIEDLGVGRNKLYTLPGDDVIADVIASWSEQIIMGQGNVVDYHNAHVDEMRRKYPIPSDIKFIFSAGASVVLGKK